MVKLILVIVCSVIAVILSKAYMALTNNNVDKQEDENNKNFLFKISKFIVREWISMFILGFLFFWINAIFPNALNLDTGLLFACFFITCLLLIPSFIAATCGKRFILGKNNGKLTACWIWGVISLVLDLYFLYVVAGNFYTNLAFVFTYLPNMLYIIACYKTHFKYNA